MVHLRGKGSLFLLGSHGHDVVSGCPDGQVLLLDGCGHHIGEEVGSAGKGGYADAHQPGRVPLVKTGGALVAEG